MARVLGLEDDVGTTLRQALLNTLRVYDDCRALPGAHKSVESGAFKNVVMRLSGTENNMRSDAFSPNWFVGVSIMPVPASEAEPLLSDPKRRASALRKLVDAIPSELADADVEVGPQLDGDPNDRDTKAWVAGFDAPSCCVGIYSARETRAPEAGKDGMDRVHNTYYLVCKAGGGIAAQTFHARLTAALGSGKSLDQALDSGHEPGPQALRRVAQAAQRNRGRILVDAANALGLLSVDTLSDQASPDTACYRVAVAPVNVSCNSLRRVDIAGDRPRSTWQYSAGCVDSMSSTGIVTASNAQQGFVLFTSQDGELRVQARNNLFDGVPFASERRLSNRDAVNAAADAHKRGGQLVGTSAQRAAPHPDHQWVRERFGWKAKDHGIDLEPPTLWGAFASENWLRSWGREIGVASMRAVTLSPEIVAIAAVEGPKLRAAARHVKGK